MESVVLKGKKMKVFSFVFRNHQAIKDLENNSYALLSDPLILVVFLEH